MDVVFVEWKRDTCSNESGRDHKGLLLSLNDYRHSGCSIRTRNQHCSLGAGIIPADPCTLRSAQPRTQDFPYFEICSALYPGLPVL